MALYQGDLHHQVMSMDVIFGHTIHNISYKTKLSGEPDTTMQCKKGLSKQSIRCTQTAVPSINLV